MSAAIVIAFGPSLFLVSPGHDRPVAYSPAADRRPIRPAVHLRPDTVPSGLLSAIAELPQGVELRAAPAGLAHALGVRCDRPVGIASEAEWHRARSLLPLREAAEERKFIRDVATAELAEALRSPEELLVTLAREEERLERAVGREHRAAEAMMAVPGSPLVEYLARWSTTRDLLADHHRALQETLERMARQVVPNLSAVVGPRVAGRLVAAGGGVAALGRMRGARLQLLGSRRRPSPVRGPRFGAIYRADRMADVPIDRRAAYARTLASLAAIAVRADASTRANLAPLLVRRRDRRIDQLRRGRT
ncbi:MAG: hypothetical protein WBG19_05140 [Thermoplasmata archaeon]